MTSENEAAARFSQALLTAAALHKHNHRQWHKALNSLGAAQPCDYCQTMLDVRQPRAAVIDYLVRLEHGGPSVDENRVLSCPSCARLKGHKDLISWKAFSGLGTPESRKTLLEQRLKMLAQSANHLTYARAYAPWKTFLGELEMRWANPRFTVYAHHGQDRSYIGWTNRSGAKEAVALAAVLLRFACEAVPLSTGKLVLFEVPSDRFLDAVWTLIEHHCLVRKLDVDGLQAVPMDPDNWQHHWPVHLSDLLDLRRRRVRTTGNNAWSMGTAANAKMRFYAHDALPQPAHLVDRNAATAAPRKPRKLSESKAAIAKRERYSRKVGLSRRQAFLEGRATLDQFKERISQGLTPAPSAKMLDLMEREVLALL